MSSLNSVNTDDFDSAKQKTTNELDSLRCRLNRDDVHFLQEPKALPCRQNACLACIRKCLDAGMDKKSFNCGLCGQVHVILEELSTLPTDSTLIDQLNAHTARIFDGLTAKLSTLANNVTENLNQSLSDQNVDQLCIQARMDIEKRVDDIEAHLDTLQGEMMASLADIRTQVNTEMAKLRAEARRKTDAYKVVAERVQSLLVDVDANQEQLVNDVYLCQEYAGELKELEERRKGILRKVAFEASEWTPDEKFIGTIEDQMEAKPKQLDSKEKANSKCDLNASK